MTSNASTTPGLAHGVGTEAGAALVLEACADFREFLESEAEELHAVEQMIHGRKARRRISAQRKRWKKLAAQLDLTADEPQGKDPLSHAYPKR